MTFLGFYLIFIGVNGLFRDLQRYREQTDNMKKFCEEHNLTARLMTSVARGKYTNHKGWKVVTVEELDKKM